jgi:hypothetical protein
MRKITFIIFSVFFILSTSINVHAQLVRIGVGGGLTNVLGPDESTKDVNNGGLGFSSEYNFGIIAKIGLPLMPITPRGFVLFHNFNGSGTPSPTGTLPKTTTTTNEVEYSQSITSVGLGVQFEFIPIPAGIDPYLSLDLTFNNFGKFKVNSESAGETVSRGGLQLGVGAEVSIIPVINLDVFAGYKLFNLTGKEDGEETLSALVLDLFVTLNFL